MEYYYLYNQAIERIQLLEQYIDQLEAERDYYQESSEFAGVPSMPPPEDAFTKRP